MSDAGTRARTDGSPPQGLTRRKPGAHVARPSDTTPEVWDRLTQQWSSMSPAERAELAASMSAALADAARAGILADEPGADEGRVRYLLTQRRYGTDLAEAAFGPHGRWPQ